MSEPPFPEDLTPPRLAGIREQISRAQMHLREALASADPTTRFRKLIAAVYPGRAAVEIMREAAAQGEVAVDRDELDRQVAAVLPHHQLIQAIRFHDFHRFGVIERPGVFIGGPMRIRTRKGGGAQIQFLPSGPRITKRGNADVVLNRPLQMNSGRVFDDASRDWVPIEQAIRDYVEALPAALELFECLWR
jgi:hypothetical protein